MKSKQTVFYIRTDLSNNKLVAGGSVSHTLGVIQGFLDHGYAVIVASSIMADQIMGCAIQNFTLLCMPKKIKWLRLKINCFLSTFVFLKQCFEFLKKIESIDYLYQRYSILNFTGILLSYVIKVPFILEYNGSEVWVDKYWSQKKIISFRWLIGLVEWLNLICANRIIVVSKPLYQELINRGICSKKIIVNPNGVNTACYDPAILANDRSAIRSLLDWSENFIFGFIGTFSVWHGIEMLVAMIPTILEQKPHARFLLIGDGPLLGHLQSQLQKFIEGRKVICTGMIAQHEAKNYLASCDAFLSPTQPNPDGTPFFGSPTKLFEYLSMAKPVIASELEQIAEVISPALKVDELQDQMIIKDHIGIVIAPKNVQDFIRAACWLVNLELMQREQLGYNARAKAVREYDWKKHVEKIMGK